MLGKNDLPEEIVTARTVVRRARADDLPQIAAWPDYAWPHDVLGMTHALARDAGGDYWWARIDEPDRCHYSVVLRDGGEVIGLHAFVRIDWAAGVVGNMGVRIRSDRCDDGYGTESLRPLLAGVLDAGIGSIRLDVAAPNPRAVRCYEKCGMRTTGELWQAHRGEPIDPADPKWSFVLPHARHEDGRWMIRFYWMEIAGASDDRGAADAT